MHAPQGLLNVDYVTKIRAVNRTWFRKYDSLKSRVSDIGKVVMGVDYGGTTIKMDTYTYLSNGVFEKLGESHIVASPKGVEGFFDVYIDLLEIAMGRAAERNSVLVGTSCVTPGRYLSSEGYKLAGYQRPSRGNSHIYSHGGWSADYRYAGEFGWPKPINDILANGSNPHMGKKPDDFDSLRAWSMFQRFTPQAIQAVATNDAGAQAMAMRHALSSVLKGKTMFYYGPGTGTGGGFIDRDGQLRTDCHPQYLKMKRLANDQAGDKVFDLIRSQQNGYYPTNEEYINPEHLLSATGITNVLRSVYGAEFSDKDFDPIYADQNDHSEQKAETISRLEALGRYVAEYISIVHSGEFTMHDPKAEWPQSDKDLVKGFDVVGVGGGISKAPYFREVIMATAKARLEEKGLGNIEFVYSEKASPSFAAVLMLDKNGLDRSIDQIVAQHKNTYAVKR